MNTPLPLGDRMRDVSPVIVAHGTRNPHGVTMIAEIAAAVSERIGTTRTAFVDVLGPTPAEVLSDLADDRPAVPEIPCPRGPRVVRERAQPRHAVGMRHARRVVMRRERHAPLGRHRPHLDAVHQHHAAEVVAVTRVVEEREWKDGKLYEVAKNYFGICAETKDVYYFGEDVDFYKDGKVVKHDGTWHAGVNGNRHGLMMPGAPKPKMKYYQELAPGVAMDRAEIVSTTETCKVPAGTFKNCLKVKETSAIDRLASEFKYYAPDIGLIRDEDLRLVRYGPATK